MKRIVIIGMDDSRFATWFAMALRARGHLGTADFNDSFAAVMLDSKQFDSIGEKTEKDLEQRQIAASSIKNVVLEGGYDYVVTVDQKLRYVNPIVKKMIQDPKDGSGNYPRLLHVYDPVATRILAEGIKRIDVIGDDHMMSDKLTKTFFHGRHHIQVVGTSDMQAEKQIIHGMCMVANSGDINHEAASSLTASYVKSLLAARREHEPEAVVILHPFLAEAISGLPELIDLPVFDACQICVDALLELRSKE